MSLLAKIPDSEPPAGVTYIGPRALVLAFALACALLVAAFFGLDRLTAVLESGEAASSELAPPALPELGEPLAPGPVVGRANAGPRAMVPVPPRPTPIPAVAHAALPARSPITARRPIIAAAAPARSAILAAARAPLPVPAHSPIPAAARSPIPAAARPAIAQPLRGRQSEAHISLARDAPRIALAKDADSHVRARNQRAAAPTRPAPQAPLLIPFRSASNALFVPLRAAQTPAPATAPAAPPQP